MLAKDIVRETLLACLPPGAPPSFTDIYRAKRLRPHGRDEITASLVMFDGEPATVVLRKWVMGWSHQFVELPGGDISFEDGAWKRVRP